MRTLRIFIWMFLGTKIAFAVLSAHIKLDVEFGWMGFMLIIMLEFIVGVAVDLIINESEISPEANTSVPNFKHDKSKFLVLGGAGPGRKYHMVNGKECIYVPLRKIEMKYNTLLLDDITEPVLYGKYSIFCIYGNLFLYAVSLNGAIYSFDIREIAGLAKLPDPQDEISFIIENKREWLEEFFKRLESSPFFFDIENSYILR